MSAQLVLALDCGSSKEALALAGLVQPQTPWMKVGLELFTACGPDLVRALKGAGCLVFLDLKFHDIPNTAKGAVRSAVALGVDMCNIHVCGGERMARAALDGLEEGWELSGRAAPRPLLLGVTVLTSQGAKDLAGQEPAGVVLERAGQAKTWGLGGVVCSAQEAAAIKTACGKDFICLCPGIRPAGVEWRDDQRRTMTPAQAVSAGADFLVVGRPISGAEDPAAAAKTILMEMRGKS